jgi:hypothetical protein
VRPGFPHKVIDLRNALQDVIGDPKEFLRLTDRQVTGERILSPRIAPTLDQARSTPDAPTHFIFGSFPCKAVVGATVTEGQAQSSQKTISLSSNILSKVRIVHSVLYPNLNTSLKLDIYYDFVSGVRPMMLRN